MGKYFNMAIILLFLFIEIHAAPREIATCASSNCLLGMPRYKSFMSATDPNAVWLAYQRSSSNFIRTTDGGATWSAPITVKSWLDYHGSVDGDAAGNIYVTDLDTGAAYFRKANFPGTSTSDLGPEMHLTSSYLPSGVATRNNVLAQSPTSIWVFARTSTDATGNVRYFHSTDGGATFPQQGWVSNTGYDNVRIGSMLIDGQPAVIIWYSEGSSSVGWGYKYFIWDGSSFVEKPDSTIIWGSQIYLREYGMNYVNGEVHIVYPDRWGNLYDSWKSYNGGTGTWTQTLVEHLSITPAVWHPSLTRHGNDLYLFYIIGQSQSSYVNNIFYRKWNSVTKTWGPSTQLTFDSNDVRHPQGPAFVNPSANYIPVFWSAEPGVVMFETISTTGSSDTAPPAAILNLAATASTSSTVTLQWAAPGDDGSTGTATSYDVRYSTSTITSSSFAAATAATGEPAPLSPGTSQTMQVTGLNPSTLYYFAIKTGDEVPNWSAISNVVSRPTSAAADSTPPAAITNLAATASTSSTVTLQWTAPGDDGSTGTATSYDVRYSTSTITSSSFAAATAATGEPAPLSPGTSQTMQVTGLNPSTLYYFAIKTGDEVPNWSAISNIASRSTTALADTTPPSTISNLQVTALTSNSATLQWTSPGDDGSTGTATSYDARYSISSINDGNWGSASQVTGEPAPLVAGSAQTLAISGLSPSTLYYFAIKAADEVPNWSGLSNLASGITTAETDITPPAAITNLAATASTSSTVTLQWSAPGDDGSTGTATSYDMRYSTSTITSSSYASATQATSEPAPLSPGTSQTMQVTGLNPSTLYYFAIKTGDEVPNWSAISNIASRSTTAIADSTPPAAIGDLSAISSTANSVTLQWTSPGDDGFSGTASQYDIRYSFNLITDANWDSRYQSGGEPTPAVAGTAQTFTVPNLNPSTIYYFGIKTSDEVPNVSPLSNIASRATSDNTAPAAISDLDAVSKTTTSITIQWTAPGDDGSTGTAAQYDVRYSTLPIIESNFAAATQASGEPTPAIAGTIQQFVVTGLTPSTGYYFIIKTADEIPNWSTLSNQIWEGTLTPDTSPPSGITNLAATASTPTSVSLQWTSPGDDANSGTASQYDLRHSLSTITASTFASATQVSGEPLPSPAGSTEMITVSGLTSSTLYYFAIRTADEVPNWSGISNVPSRATLAPPDNTAPAAITNLAITGQDYSSISLQWTSPGDDGSTGTATSYDLRYSTSLITAGNFNSAFQVLGEPAPAIAGTVQVALVGSLNPSTTYYLAIRTADEVPNWSAISNVVSGTTSPAPDNTPPTISNGAPSGQLPAGTTSSQISVSTNEPATCKYSQGTDHAYELMPNTFSTTGGSSHSSTISGLSNGQSYTFYVRCEDAALNENPTSYQITFGVDTPPNQPPQAYLDSPGTGFKTYSGNVRLTCSATDDYGLTRLDLHTDISGTFELTQSKPISEQSTTQEFLLTGLQPGIYEWNCIAYDGGGLAGTYSLNFVFEVIEPVYSISISPASDAFQVKNGTGEMTNRSFTITNTGNQNLTDGSCSSTVGWAQFFGCRQVLNISESEIVVVGFNVTNLPEAVHTANLLFIFSNPMMTGDSATVDITVTSDPVNPLPIISNLSAEPSHSFAAITWETDLNSNSTVIYGADPLDLNQSSGIADNVQHHSISLQSLLPNTTYHYAALSCSIGGCSISGASSFTTQELPAGCSYGNPPCGSGYSCQANACVPVYNPGGSPSGPTGSSPGSYISGSTPIVAEAKPSQSAAASAVPSATIAAESRFVDIQREFDENRETISETDRLDIEEYLIEAKRLQAEGNTAQAMVMLSRARSRLDSTLAKSREQKASFGWMASLIALIMILGGALYYSSRQKQKAESIVANDLAKSRKKELLDISLKPISEKQQSEISSDFLQRVQRKPPKLDA